ncbi:hypothetical protein BYT27DRAFT_7165507 [Phlegmacium glaucopus]|nr:hypothetical protein BYT27DRAFT_7165507 [Phlegmacium glaucopus]
MPPPSLAKRLLSPNDPLPLLISQDLTPELYDFIAITLRAYVSPWWSKISRYDKDLLPHITRILISVIRALHSRTQALDIQSLVFRDAPPIITQHYRDYRNAASKTSTAYATGGAVPLSALFFHLQPHIAILPNGSLDPEYYRQIVDHILKACLPPEDYDPEPERLIVREIIVKVLLNDIIPKITQPWFIHKTILDLIGPPEDQPYFAAPPHPQLQPSLLSSSFSFHTLIIFVLSALQSFSGMCLALIHAYKQALSTIKRVHQSPPRTPQPTSSTPLTTTPPEPLVFSTQKISLPTSASAASSTSSSPSAPALSTASVDSSPTISRTTSIHQPHADYAQAPLAMISEITCSRDRFSSTIIFTTLSMIATSMTPFLDKLLPHLLSNFLSPAFILNITKTAKRTLFPNGYPGPPPIDPSPEEQAELIARLVAWRGKGGIGLLFPILLGPDPSSTLSAALDPLSSAQCNRHLVVFLLDRILIGLFPELACP